MRRRLPILLLSLISGLSAMAQTPPPNPVFVNDSNEARRLLDQAEELASTNPDEAIRLIQSVLDEQRGTVVEDPDEPGRFVSTRQTAHQLLQNRPALLDTYEQLENRRALQLRAEKRNRVLLETRALTSAGLQALLEAAQNQLEQGNFSAAAGWLEEGRRHPRLSGEDRRRVLVMLALTRFAQGDQAEFETWRDELMADPAASERWAEMLATWTDLPPPSPRAGRDSSAPAPDVAGSLLMPAMWEIDYLRTPANINRVMARPEDEEQLLASGRLTTVLPVIQGQAVYFNEGAHLTRTDLLTGVEQWRRPLLPEEQRVDQTTDPIGPTALAVTDEDVVAWVGFSLPGGTSEIEQVVCLDSATGQERWRFDLGQTPGIDLPQTLYPASPPIIQDNLVYLVMRRDSRQGLKSGYLLALDRMDGTPVFHTYLASTGSQIRDGSLRPLTKPVLADYRVIVATSIGAIAAVNQATGHIDWLQRMDTPVGGTQALSSIRPYDYHLPLVFQDQIISLSPDFRSVIRLDRDSGRVLERIRIDDRLEWNACRYLLTDGQLVFAVGSSITAFDPKDLSRVVWSTQPRQTGEGQGQPLAGRVHVAGGRLYVPTGQAVVELDSRTGDLLRRLPLPESGLPQIVDGHLLFSGPRGLSFHANSDSIEQTLARRLADRPDNLSTRIAFARAAARAGNQPALVGRVEDVLTQLEEDPNPQSAEHQPVRRLLFEEIVTTLQPKPSIPAEEREIMTALFDRLTGDTSLEPEARLVLGDWIAAGDLPAAVEWWQGLTNEPDQGRALMWQGEILAPASFWANQRLREAYQADATLSADTTFTPGDARTAWSSRVADLAAAIRQHPPAKHLTVSLADALEDSITLQRSRDGLALLELWKAQHPTADALPPPRSGGNWKTILTAAARPALPLTAHNGRSQHWNGVLVDQGEPYRAPVHRQDWFLRSRGDHLIYHTAPDYQPRWDVRVPHRKAQIIHQDQDVMILRLENLGQLPQIVALRTSDGSTAWAEQPTNAFFQGQPVASSIPRRAASQSGPQTGEISMISTAAGVTLVQHSGKVVSLDHETGQTQWRNGLPGYNFYAPTPWRDGVALIAYARAPLDPNASGQTSETEDYPAMMLLWFDAATGEQRITRLPEELGEPVWVQSDPLGHLILRGTDGLALFPEPGGELGWLSRAWPLQSHQSLGKAIVTPQAVIIKDLANMQHSFSLETGRRMETNEHRDPAARNDSPSLHVSGDRVWVRHDDTIDIMDTQGSLVGSDVISQTQGQALTAVAPFADGLAVVAHQRGSHAVKGERRGSGQRRHLVYLLSPEGRTEEILELFNLNERVKTARAVEGRLVLGSDAEILVVEPPARLNR